MILRAAEDISNDEIAERLDTRREVVSLWRKRFFTDRPAGLEEHARPGSPRISPQTGSADWPGCVRQRKHALALAT